MYSHLSHVMRLCDPLHGLRAYDGAAVSYNIYAVDTIVRSDGQVYIVEFNGNPGFSKLGLGPKSEIAEWWFGGVKEFVLEYDEGAPLEHLVPLPSGAPRQRESPTRQRG